MSQLTVFLKVDVVDESGPDIHDRERATLDRDSETDADRDVSLMFRVLTTRLPL